MWWHSSQIDSDKGNSGSISLAIQDKPIIMSQTTAAAAEASAGWKQVKNRDLNDDDPCLERNAKSQNKTVSLKDNDDIKITLPHFDKPTDDGLSVMRSSKGTALAAPPFTESPSTDCLQFDELSLHGNIIVCAYKARPVMNVANTMDASVVHIEMDTNSTITALQTEQDNATIPVAVPYSRKESRLLRQRWKLWLAFMLAVVILVTVTVGVMIAVGVFPRTKASDSQSLPQPPSLPPSYLPSQAPSVLAPLTASFPKLVTTSPSPTQDVLNSTLIPVVVPETLTIRPLHL